MRFCVAKTGNDHLHKMPANDMNDLSPLLRSLECNKARSVCVYCKRLHELLMPHYKPDRLTSCLYPRKTIETSLILKDENKRFAASQATS